MSSDDVTKTIDDLFAELEAASFLGVEWNQTTHQQLKEVTGLDSCAMDHRMLKENHYEQRYQKLLAVASALTYTDLETQNLDHVREYIMLYPDSITRVSQPLLDLLYPGHSEAADREFERIERAAFSGEWDKNAAAYLRKIFRMETLLEQGKATSPEHDRLTRIGIVYSMFECDAAGSPTEAAKAYIAAYPSSKSHLPANLLKEIFAHK